MALIQHPALSTEEEDYIPARMRVRPARQLCHGSSREFVDRPLHDRCVVCDRSIAVIEVPGTRRVSDGTGVKDVRTVKSVFIVESHLPKRE